MSTPAPADGVASTAGLRERARLEALAALHLLDEPVAEGISDIVRLAAEVCGVPFAMMNIIDDKWQRTVSSFGFDVPSLPRSDAMCNTVVSSGMPLIMTDASKHPVFKDHPIVNGDLAAVQFYAAVPLETDDGHIVGTLCAYDLSPHPLAPNQLSLLTALARQAMGIVELRRAVAEASLATDRLAEQATRVTAVLESSRDAYIALDLGGFVTSWNQAAEQIFGYSRTEATGRSLGELIVPPSHLALFGSLMTPAEPDGKDATAPAGPPRLRTLQVPALTRDRRELLIDLTIWQDGEGTEWHTFGRDVTQLQADQREREAAEERWRVAFERAPMGMVVTDLTDPALPRIQSANHQFCQMVGRSLDDVLALSSLHDITHPADQSRDAAAIAPLLSGELRSYRTDKRYLHADGSILWGRLSASIARTGQGSYLISQVEDITEWRAADAARRQAENLLTIAFEHAPLGIAVIGVTGPERGRLQRVNPALCAMTGRDDLDGAELGSLLDAGADLDGTLLTLAEFSRLADGEQDRFQRTCQLRAGAGQIFADVFIALSRSHSGAPEHALAQLRDVTIEKAHERWLTTRASTDELTGVANRLAMRERLNTEIDALRLSEGVLVVLMVDLDRFKSVNDTFGHEAGDELLRQVSAALVQAVPSGALVARLGGDEFLVIVPGQQHDSAEKLRQTVRSAVEEVGRQYQQEFGINVGASVGVSSTVNPSTAPEDLIRAADQAMYETKRAHQRASRR